LLSLLFIVLRILFIIGVVSSCLLLLLSFIVAGLSNLFKMSFNNSFIVFSFGCSASCCSSFSFNIRLNSASCSSLACFNFCSCSSCLCCFCCSSGSSSSACSSVVMLSCSASCSLTLSKYKTWSPL